MPSRSEYLFAVALGMMAVSRTDAQPAMAADFSLRAIPEIRRSNDASWLDAAALGHQGAITVDAELRLQSRGVTAVGTLLGRDSEHEAARGHATLNELFHESGWGSTRLSIGKRILSWDVGIGYRPLDVLQRDDQRQLVESTFVGVTMVALDHYTERNAVSVVLANPGSGRGRDAKHDASVAMRLYHRGEGWDGYLIARHSRRRGIEIGPAWSSTIGDGLELHASLALQQRDGYAPIGGEVVDEPSLKALAGFNLTLRSGLSLVAEYWFDGTAPPDQAWDCLQQSDLCGANPQVPVNAHRAVLFTGDNLRRDNVFTRMSAVRGNWESALDAVLTPEDGGHVLTASIRRQAVRHSVQLGFRAFGGGRNAPYRHVPTRYTAFMAWQLRL